VTGTIIAAVIGALVLALVVTVALGASRLRVLSRRIGSFECSVRPGGAAGESWTAGIAHYGAGRIDWWRAWSLGPRPACTWWRADLEVVDRAPFLGPGGVPQLVVRCRYHGRELELTMSDDAFAGFTAWLESAPPSDVSRVI
jgi:Protein of unknown function (DUF2550)